MGNEIVPSPLPGLRKLFRSSTSVTVTQRAVGSVLEAPRALVVDDHRVFAEALAANLSARGFECRVARLDGSESVPAQAAALRPAVILLDLDLGSSDGMDLIGALRATRASVVVVTADASEARMAEAVYLGAAGWVEKAEPFERLLAAAELAAAGQPLMAPSRAAELWELGSAQYVSERELKRSVAQLTLREQEVLDALDAGKGAEEIASEFVVSVGTVRTHIRGVLTKLGVSSQLAAVAKYRHLVGACPPGNTRHTS